MKFSYTRVGEDIYETARCDCGWTAGPFNMTGPVNTTDLTDEHEAATGHPAMPESIALDQGPTDPDDEDDPFVLDTLPPQQIAALGYLHEGSE